MKKIIPASILALAVATGFLFNNKPAQANGFNHGGSARGYHNSGSARGYHRGGYSRGYYHRRYYAHGYYHGGFGGFYGGYSPFYYGGFGAYPLASCYPDVRENSAYHPQAYADGYTQGQRSSAYGDKYERRTAGGEFARGFRDGYYGKEFSGQKIVVPDRYVSGGCGFY